MLFIAWLCENLVKIFDLIYKFLFRGVQTQEVKMPHMYLASLEPNSSGRSQNGRHDS
jgi:hypothetical protein